MIESRAGEMYRIVVRAESSRALFESIGSHVEYGGVVYLVMSFDNVCRRAIMEPRRDATLVECPEPLEAWMVRVAGNIDSFEPTAGV